MVQVIGGYDNPGVQKESQLREVTVTYDGVAEKNKLDVHATATDLDIRPLVASDVVTANLQAYRSSDASFQPARLDKATNTIQTIDYAHHEIHSGSHFLYTDHVELDSASTQDYLITTPDSTKYAHMLFDLYGSAITQWQLYESSDKTGTSAQTVGNSNRNSATTATVTVHKGTSGGTTDGNLIHIFKGGSATAQSRGSSGIRNDEEIILKRNTKYILRVTSGTNDNLTNIRLSWYEHTDIA